MNIKDYSKELKASEVVVALGLVAFAYYRYSKMTEREKNKIHNDLQEIGEKIAKELVPPKIKSFLPEHWK